MVILLEHGLTGFHPRVCGRGGVAEIQVALRHKKTSTHHWLNVLILAPTGVVAINIDGTTLVFFLCFVMFLKNL